MRLRCLYIVIINFVLLNVFGQNTFQKKLSSSAYEEPSNFILHQSNLYFSGSYAESQTQRLYKSFIAKYDANMNYQWAKKLNTADFSLNFFNSIIHQNYMYVVGERHVYNVRNDWDAVVCKLDLNGNIIWSKVLDLGIGTQFQCIMFDNEKNKFVLAGTHIINERTEKNLLIMEMDIDGNISLLKAINTASDKQNIVPTYITKNAQQYQILAKAVMTDNVAQNYGFIIEMDDTYNQINYKKIIIDDQFTPIKSFYLNNKNYVFGYSEHLFFVNRQAFWSNHVVMLAYENNQLIDSSFHILGNIHEFSTNETVELMRFNDVEYYNNSFLVSGTQNDNIFNLQYNTDESVSWAKYYGASGTERLGFAEIENNNILTLSFTQSFTPRSGDIYAAKTKWGNNPDLSNVECTDSLKYMKTQPFYFNAEEGSMININLGGVSLSNLVVNEEAINFTPREFCYVEPPEVRISPNIDSICIDFNDPVPYFRVFDVGEYLPAKIYEWKYTTPSGQIVSDNGTRTGNFRIPKYGNGSLEPGLYTISLKACIISELDSSLVCAETKDSIFVKAKRKPIIADVIEVCDSPSFTLNIHLNEFEIVRWNTGGSDTSKTFTQTGNYYVITRNYCGLDTTRFRIVFKTCNTDLPNAQFNVVNTFACKDSCITLNNTSTNANSYYWTFSGANIQSSTLKNPSVCYENKGEFNISLKAENRNGSDLYSQTVNVIEQPSVQLENKYTFCEGENIRLYAPSGENYIWSLDETSNSHLYDRAGRFAVKNTNACGTSVKYIQIFMEDCHCNVFVPNAFTPNGDGINDEVKVYSACIFNEFLFQIYDRWGEKVFETDNMDKWWNGSNRNQKLRNDLYFYTLNYTDKFNHKQFKKGEINLIY